MLDPVACTGMELGRPCVSVDALIGLIDLLIAQGARESSSIAESVVEETPDETVDAKIPRQSAPDADGVRDAANARNELAPTRGRPEGARNIADGSRQRKREGGVE